MIRLIKGLIKLCVVLVIIILLLAAFVVFGGACAANLPTPVNMARTAIVNTVLDATGVKARINDALMDNVTLVAEKTGLSETALTSAIDSLDILNWEVTDLPANAHVTGTYSLPYQGQTLSITTYETNDIVTVTAAGQTLTMRVPDSARTYIAFLKYF